MSRQLHTLILALIVMVFFLSWSLSVYPQFQFYGSKDVLMTSGLGIYFFCQENSRCISSKTDSVLCAQTAAWDDGKEGQWPNFSLTHCFNKFPEYRLNYLLWYSGFLFFHRLISTICLCTSHGTLSIPELTSYFLTSELCWQISSYLDSFIPPPFYLLIR